jgi:hypothetical protein
MGMNHGAGSIWAWQWKVTKVLFGGLRLLEKRWSRSWSLQSWVLWFHRLHLLVGKATAPPPHMLQYGAAPLSKCLVGLQQEVPKKPELEPCQTGPKKWLIKWWIIYDSWWKLKQEYHNSSLTLLFVFYIHYI